MGASGSIQSSPIIEISFIDKNTGSLLTDEKINKIIKEVEFDFSKEFYNAYKKNDKNSPYYKYQQWLLENK
jgi:hypothetical protein